MTKWAILAVCAVLAPLAVSRLQDMAPKAEAYKAGPEPKAAQAAALGPAAVSLHADAGGHFHTDVVVDGRALRMVVDTGATLCAFSQEDAERIGIRVGANSFTREVMTANGPVRVASVRIGLIRIGPVAVRDVEAVVVPRGLLATNLLGMSFLKRVRDFSVAGGRLTLRG
jgi:aspartyl protease family protein